MLYFKGLERATGKNFTVEIRMKSRVLRALENATVRFQMWESNSELGEGSADHAALMARIIPSFFPAHTQARVER